MEQLIAEAQSDLVQLGVREPNIELHAFETVMAFAKHGLRGFLGDVYGEEYAPIPTSLVAALPPCDEIRPVCLPAEEEAPQLAVAEDAEPQLAVPFSAAGGVLVD